MGDVIYNGDYVHQVGDHNQGVVRQSATNHSQSNLTFADQAEAMREFAELLRELERTGAFSGGRIQDGGSIERAIESAPTRFQSLCKVVAAGAGATLSRALDHAAGPVLVSLLEKRLL